MEKRQGNDDLGKEMMMFMSNCFYEIYIEK